MRVIIVASGPSAKHFVPPPNVTVIAVNGVIDWIARADYWFTLDPSKLNMQRMAMPRKGVKYCAAVPQGYPLPSHVNTYLRVSQQGLEPRQRHTPSWWLWRWGAVVGLNKQAGCINTGNSAYGAVNLAYHLGAKKIMLVGVDASQHPRIEGGTPNNLSHLPLLFSSLRDELPIVNCGNMQSNLPKMSIEQGLAWLQE